MFSAVFVFQVFRLFKVPKKFWKNYIKNQRKGTFRKNQEGAGGPPPGTQAPWWCAPGDGHARGAPGSLVDPLAAPLRLYITPAEETPNIEVFSRSPLCTAAAAISRLGLPGDAARTLCRKEESPPGVPPSPWTPPGCAVSSPPWAMGP